MFMNCDVMFSGGERSTPAPLVDVPGYQGYSGYSGHPMPPYPSGSYSSSAPASQTQSSMEQQIWDNYMASIQPPQPDHYRARERSPPRDYDRRRDDRDRRGDDRDRRDDRRDDQRSRERGRDERRARSRSPAPMVDNFMKEPDVEKEIVIDDALTSFIIGPKGTTIGAVRNNTSAKVKIGKSEGQMTNHDQVTAPT